MKAKAMVQAVASLDGPQVQAALWSVLEDPAQPPGTAVIALAGLRASPEETRVFVDRLEALLAEVRARGGPAALLDAIQRKLERPDQPGLPAKPSHGAPVP